MPPGGGSAMVLPDRAALGGANARRGGSYVFGAVGCCGSAAIAGDRTGVSARLRAAQQGSALSGRPAQGGRDHRRHAHRRRRRARRADQGAESFCGAPGCGSTKHCRSPRPTSSRPRVDSRPPRQGRQAPRGRDGRVGMGTRRTMASDRLELPVGPFFCVIDGADLRCAPGRRPALAPSCDASPPTAGVRRRFAPHQLRHAHAVEMAREGVPLPVIQRQLGHAHLGVTSTYLQGIDTSEIIEAIHSRRPPMIPASAGLRL